MRSVIVLAIFVGTAFADPAQLPAKHTKTLHRLLAEEKLAQKWLTPETCAFDSRDGAVRVFNCTKRICDGACHGTRIFARARLHDNGTLAVRDIGTTPIGDTGECGCCMHVE